MDYISTWTKTDTSPFEKLKTIYPALEKGDCILERKGKSWNFYRFKEENYRSYRLDSENELVSPILRCIFSHPVIFKPSDSKIIQLFETQIKNKIQVAGPLEAKLLELASDYNGKRAALRKLTEAGKENPLLLDFHMEIMKENQKLFPGFLCAAQKDDAQVFIIGASPLALATKEELAINHHSTVAEMIDKYLPDLISYLVRNKNLYAHQNMFNKDLERKAQEIYKKASERNVLEKPLVSQPSEAQILSELKVVRGIPYLIQNIYQSEAREIHTLVSEEDYLKEIGTSLPYRNFNNSLLVDAMDVIDSFQWENREALEDIYAEMPADVREQWEKMNETIVNQIAQLKDGLIVAAGASCLGEKSILAFLKKLGYAIIPIPLSLAPIDLNNHIKNYKS